MNIAEAVDWLSGEMFDNEGVSIVYSRGLTDLSITAVLGRTNWEAEDAEGTTVRADSPDFMVKATDLGALTAPADGDEITYDGRTFGVMSPGGANPWQWADGARRSVYRIHTKHTG